MIFCLSLHTPQCLILRPPALVAHILQPKPNEVDVQNNGRVSRPLESTGENEKITMYASVNRLGRG